MAPTAVITGTASGIGRATALAFLRDGYTVLGVDVKPIIGSAEVDFKQRGRYRHIIADISDSRDVFSLHEAALDFFSQSQKVNVIVNNAGIADPFFPADRPSGACVEHWGRVIATNLTGAYLVTLALDDLLPAGAASIIHISSVRALQSEPGTEAYAAAKAGLLGLAHAQAASLAGRVRVNAVLPGWIHTGGEPLRQEDHQWHPAGRVGRPEDVAELCLFLADPAKSGFITGQQFVVDGGVTKKLVYLE